MENPVLSSSCVTPAGTSIEVQNEWEENTHNTSVLSLKKNLNASKHFHQSKGLGVQRFRWEHWL